MVQPRAILPPAARNGILLLYLVILGVKVVVAGQLGLYADEAFYWQCAQRLDVAYADLPPLTALLVRLGTEVAGNTPIGVRLPFLVLGALFPLVIYRLALPLVGRRDAWLAALFSLATPGLAYMGAVAIPDVPLLFFSALYLLGIERATRTGGMRYWVLAGLVGALGAATHYRFVLAPASAALFLLATPTGRRRLRKGGVWVSVALLGLGFLPAIAYNALNDFAPLRHHIGSRHGASIRPDAVWKFFVGQVAVATPLLFVAFLAAVKGLARRALKGDDRAQLLGAFAVVPFGLFLLASPFETTNLAKHHWPIPGYIPLLVFLPFVLRRFALRGQLRRALAFLAPALGVLALLSVGLELMTGLFGTSARRPFSGWSEVTAAVEAHVGSDDLIVVADNFKLGANLAFESNGKLAPYVLNHPKNRKHGRAPQYETWGIGEDALHERVGADAIVVIQVKELRSADRPAWRDSVANRFETFESLGEVAVYVGGRSVRFELVRATGVRAQ